MDFKRTPLSLRGITGISRLSRTDTTRTPTGDARCKYSQLRYPRKQPGRNPAEARSGHQPPPDSVSFLRGSPLNLTRGNFRTQSPTNNPGHRVRGRFQAGIKQVRVAGRDAQGAVAQHDFHANSTYAARQRHAGVSVAQSLNRRFFQLGLSSRGYRWARSARLWAGGRPRPHTEPARPPQTQSRLSICL